MKTRFLTKMLLLMLTQIGLAQIQLDKAKIDSYFDALEKNNKFMGSVAVLKNGTIYYTKTIGYEDIEKNVKADENSKYRIGSITKTFTAILVFKALEDNLITIDQTIDEWFPTIKNANKITIKQLLGHRSGISDFTEYKDYFSWHTKPKSRTEMIEIISKEGSTFKPNKRAEYSNSNFILLTYILEDIYHKSYADLIIEKIANPLGLNNTYVFGAIDSNKKECNSYKYSGNWILEPETHYSIPLGSGAVTSTPLDLVKFSEALFNDKILTSQSLEMMKTISDGYGLGLFEIPFDQKIGYGHTGAIDEFSSIFSYFPNDSISFALISNGDNYNLNEVAITVLSAVYNIPYDVPEFRTYEVSSNDLDKYLGIYTSNEIKLKITVTKDGNRLIAQATNQPALYLDATEKDKFTYDQAGAVFYFVPSENILILHQGGGEIKFIKK